MTPPPEPREPHPSGRPVPVIQQLATRTVYRNPWMTVREDQIRRPDGSQGVYGVIDKPDFALVIPADRGGFWLVEQYRYTVGGRFWEFPQRTQGGDRPARRASGASGAAPRRLRDEQPGVQRVPGDSTGARSGATRAGRAGHAPAVGPPRRVRADDP